MFTRRRVLLAFALAAVALGLGLLSGPLRGEYHLRRARAAAEAQDFPRAYGQAVQALRLRPGLADAHLLAARCARRAGLLKEAAEHLEAFQVLHKSIPEEARLEWRLLHAQEGRLGDVEPALRRDVDGGHADRALMLEALVQGYMKLEQYDVGQAALAKLLAANPESVWGIYWRGRVMERGGKVDEAEADYRQVLARSPDHVEARMRMTELLLGDRPGEALGHVDYLLRLRPDDAGLRVARAVCLKAMGDADAAARVLDDVLADHPDDARALSERGLVAVQSGRATEGEKWLREAVRLRPAAEDTHYHLYQCLAQQPGRAAEARRQFEEWHQAKEEANRLMELGTVLRAKALHDPALMHEWGTLLLKAHHDEQALACFDLALRLRPDYQPTHRALEEYHRAKGDAARP